MVARLRSQLLSREASAVAPSPVNRVDLSAGWASVSNAA